MSRRRKQAFRSRALSDLTRQLLYSPAEIRVQVVKHAEQLHDELDPAKNYPIDFVVYRLTKRRIPPSESVLLVGEAVMPDLRLLIDTLSRSITMPQDVADPGLTTGEMAELLNVSTKTIGRWRDRGLRWRWGIRGDKPAVLITRSALAAFDQSQAGRVSAASAFTRLSEKEKSTLIKRAKRLAMATEVKPQMILAHLSKRSGRSLEAIRQLIQDHDQAQHEAAVFSGQTGPLTEVLKADIAEDYVRGATVTELCERFGKTRSTIYRAIYEQRAKQIAAMDISVVYSPIFDREDADEVLMRSAVKPGKTRWLGAEVVVAMPEKLRPIYDKPIQPDTVVRSRIVRYNFLKYRAKQLQLEISNTSPKAGVLNQFDELIQWISHARGEVIVALLPVAFSVVRRQQTGDAKSRSDSLFAMLHTAHRVMIEEIDLYDAAVSHTLESVLTNRILRVLAGPIATDRDFDESALIGQLSEAGYCTA